VQAHIEMFRGRLAAYPDWPELDELDACPVADVPGTDRPAPEPAA
jgi:glutathione-regulated potassium-efflux system ancillary protein KefF